MKHTSMEEQLTYCEPPEAIDYEHHYQLRRALLGSSYFEDSFLGLFYDRVRYYLTRQGVVVGSTILLVGGIGVMSTFSSSSLAVQRQGDRSQLFMSEETAPVGGALVEDIRALKNSQEDMQAAFAMIQEEGPSQTRSLQFVSFEEMTAMMLKALAEKNGRLIFDSEEEGGVYVYAFATPSSTPSVSPFFFASVPEENNVAAEGTIQLISH